MNLPSPSFATPSVLPMTCGNSLRLTAEQQAILQHRRPSLVIAALAGTGKTTTLACRVVQRLQAQPQARILVLACSKAGVAAFQARLQRLLPQRPPQLLVTTLERWAARQLRRQDPHVQFLVDPLALRTQVLQAWDWLQEQQHWRPDPLLVLPHTVDLDAFWAFHRQAKKSLLFEQMQEQDLSLAEWCDQYLLDYSMVRLYQAYERLRRDACDDARFYADGDCSYALAQGQTDASQWEQYDLVLFDEMHDLDLASLHVLRQLLQAPGTQFCGAGDFNQHIESQAWSVFQDKLHQLTDFLPHATDTLPLTQSRRFGPAVADAVNQWFPVGIQAAPQRYSWVARLTYTDDAHCHQLLLQAQSSLRAAPKPSGAPPTTEAPLAPTLTVILRHPHDAHALQWSLHYADKSVAFEGLRPWYLEREPALLLGLLYAHSMQDPAWKADGPCPLAAEILAAFVEGTMVYGKGHTTADAVDADSHRTQAQQMAHDMQQYPQGIWRFLIGETHLQGGQRNFAAFGRFLNLPLALQQDAHALLTHADVWGLFDSHAMPHVEREAMRQRVQALIDAVQGMPVPTLRQHVQAMARRHWLSQRQGHADFLLLTVEQAKGHEYDCVALPFLTPGRFPAPAPHELRFLERNRLYVAMTRAKRRLWLFERAGHPVQPFER